MEKKPFSEFIFVLFMSLLFTKSALPPKDGYFLLAVTLSVLVHTLLAKTFTISSKWKIGYKSVVTIYYFLMVACFIGITMFLDYSEFEMRGFFIAILIGLFTGFFESFRRFNKSLIENSAN